MKYLEFKFSLSPYNEAVCDVLAAELAEVGFDSFVHTDDLEHVVVGQVDNFPEAPVFNETGGGDEFKAYVPADSFDENALKNVIERFPLPDVQISYKYAEMPDKDWNSEWEKNYFQPIVIGDRCVVCSTFHKDVPDTEYKIVIDPRMSFGTGHHATTALMLTRILDTDMTGKTVLDMGCGTGILAFLARMRGAKKCIGVDIDEWCVDNTKDNIRLNNLDNVEVFQGTAYTLESLVPEGGFDLVLANINRNILLADMDKYVKAMRTGSELFISGFYVDDVPVLKAHAEEVGLKFEDLKQNSNWACVRFSLS